MPLDMNLNTEPKQLTKFIGLRNIVTDGSQWKYLLFYDYDSNNSEIISKIFRNCDISYLIYKTKAGIHGIGLTPMSITDYALKFQMLQNMIPEYYSGQTIRLSRKVGEIQELLDYGFEYPIIPNLIEMYSRRLFNDKPKPFFEDFQKKLITHTNWRLVFEKYWSYRS